VLDLNREIGARRPTDAGAAALDEHVVFYNSLSLGYVNISKALVSLARGCLPSHVERAIATNTCQPETGFVMRARISVSEAMAAVFRDSLELDRRDERGSCRR
jgi:hypothetical protein